MRVLAAACLFLTAPAAADPGFITIDRQDDSSRAGGELSFAPFTNGNVSGDLFRAELDGQYVTDLGLGGYVSLLETGDHNPDEYLQTGRAGPALGAIYARRWGQYGIAAHAGAVLPTGGRESPDAADIGRTASVSQTFVADGFALGGGVSPLVHFGRWFGRADLDVDHFFGCAPCSRPRSILRVDAGAGVDLGRVAVMAELSDGVAATVRGERRIVTGALSARGRFGRSQPYAAFIFGTPNAVVAFTAGVDVSLR